MKLKIVKHQRSDFKAMSMKILTLLLFVVVFSIANGQTSNKKNKTTKSRDSLVESKTIVAKTDKLVSTDTIKKAKNFIEEQTVEADSLFIPAGKFKFYKKGAHASYYADKFHNHKTASGKKYDKNKYTAAHKKLPFGTIIKITNEANGKSVIVEVIDRGPFVRSREIDLSRRAFMEIASNKASGNMNVTMEVLQK